jgi:phosphatidylglycerophosphate synthase
MTDTTKANAPAARRPLTSRNSAWAGTIARACVKANLSPNTISVASVLFAAAAAALFSVTPDARPRDLPWLMIGAALMVQGRLLCNLLDGMVAIEGGKKTKSGEIYNELPDRLADPIILIGAGYCLMTPPLWGWLAAVLALLTAYVRALGVAAGASQQFCGPMAKPHRMATITVAAIVQTILPLTGFSFAVMTYALMLICAGCVITIIRRTVRIVRELEAK